MTKLTHSITRLIFVLAVAQVVSKASAADKNFDNYLLSGKELKVAITQVFNILFRLRYKKNRKVIIIIMQVPPATIIYSNNATGEVTGYGGYYYEQLLWLSLRLNFRYKI